MNTPPSIPLLSVQPSVLPAPVVVSYTLADAESDVCTIRVAYSLDNGVTYSLRRCDPASTAIDAAAQRTLPRVVDTPHDDNA